MKKITLGIIFLVLIFSSLFFGWRHNEPSKPPTFFISFYEVRGSDIVGLSYGSSFVDNASASAAF